MYIILTVNVIPVFCVKREKHKLLRKTIFNPLTAFEEDELLPLKSKRLMAERNVGGKK